MIEFVILASTLTCLLIAGFFNYRQFKKKKLARAIFTLPFSIFLFAVNIMLISFLLDKDSYERLTKEHTVAIIEFENIRAQQFKVTISPAYSQPITVELQGDQWQLDARILKWKGAAAYLGLQPVYLLERVSGRYQKVDDEIHKPRSVVALQSTDSINYWNMLIKYQELIPWLDAYYGNAVYLPMKNQAKFMVTLGQQGLIVRPRNIEAARSVQNWKMPNSQSL